MTEAALLKYIEELEQQLNGAGSITQNYLNQDKAMMAAHWMGQYMALSKQAYTLRMMHLDHILNS